MWHFDISDEKSNTVVFSKRTKLQLPEGKLQNAAIDYVPESVI